MLKIQNCHAEIDNKTILRGINLDIKPGEVHAIMGPNGSGKSTLANVLAGRGSYTLSQGSIRYLAQDLLELSPEQRAQAGLFLAFQYPVEIPGVSNVYLLKASLNAIRKARGETELDAIDFLALVKEKLKRVEMDQDFLYRSVNEGFSGGEKKRNEILQMALLEPKLAVLDETDSGLDIDALKIVSNGVNRLRSPERSMILITHYQRLLDYIKPDYVHILAGGKIIRSGDFTLAQTLEKDGYATILQEESVA
ncbi:Fe-S cluster assembly ATPase SufC [Rickettsiella endosymbiont of Dermanyssus gallinae]|uniref:Fe-S cluster assembly ATPase SufC n=1 Tax=Rickettsiella endosymbiont of Dermanyssus gallinae TaxID=2856608 RepID=UPI001C5275FA|nr:Fe-S cluster assembly ATPase SufC [Rickettsiella endosymbiont of Dermanyssus gallinae]